MTSRGDRPAGHEHRQPCVFGHVDQLRPRPRGVYGSVEAAFAGTCPAYEAMLAREDAREGMQAFIEKRPPVWRGR